MGEFVKEANDSNYSEITSKGNVIVDFWAPWCGPCMTLGPIMEELGEEMQGKVTIYKMNVDNNPQTAGKMGIRGIPTVVMYKDGKQCFNFSGAYPKEYWVDQINKNI